MIMLDSLQFDSSNCQIDSACTEKSYHFEMQLLSQLQCFGKLQKRWFLWSLNFFFRKLESGFLFKLVLKN